MIFHTFLEVNDCYIKMHEQFLFEKLRVDS